MAKVKTETAYSVLGSLLCGRRPCILGLLCRPPVLPPRHVGMAYSLVLVLVLVLLIFLVLVLVPRLLHLGLRLFPLSPQILAIGVNLQPKGPAPLRPALSIVLSAIPTGRRPCRIRCVTYAAPAHPRQLLSDARSCHSPPGPFDLLLVTPILAVR